MLMWIEFGLVLSAMVLAFCFPEMGANWFVSAERTFTGLARRQRLSILVAGLAALGARAALLPILPVPQPHINDEFSHLLLADTLVHGRLTNPTHPMWVHFETFHVLMRPTYAAMYPPGQGLVLAAGQVIAHQPFVGVWLSVGAMCAAICWMLQGWVSPEWALLGGLLAVMRLGMFSYWANSYWGGAVVAATGGALVLGAFPRIVRFERTRDALLMGLGLAILANSRPYEGFVLSLPVAAALLIWLFTKRGSAFWRSVRRVVVPLTMVLVIAALATGYYFWRVTGSPFRMPQQVDRDTYAVAPYFLWQSPKPEPAYKHEAFRELYINYELALYKQTRSVGNLIGMWILRTLSVWCFYLGPVLTLPLVMAIANVPYGLAWAQFDWQTRFLFLSSAVSIAGLAMEVFFYPHYAAPMAGLIYILIMMAISRLRAWRWRDRPVGVLLTRAVPVICCLLFLLRAGDPGIFIKPGELWTWYNASPTVTDRAKIQAQLDGYVGKHLVLVRFKPNTPYEYEWVYNEADIDNSRIVWAWDMGASENQKLVDYFKDRDVWQVEMAANSPKCSPYQIPAAP
jgi:hypothetical protein